LAIIVDSTDNYLIVQKKGFSLSQWTLVGGGQKAKETLLSGLCRELEEETGLRTEDVFVRGPSKIRIKYNYPLSLAGKVHSGKYIGQDYNFCLVKLLVDPLKLKLLAEEIKDYKWVPLGELKNFLTFPGQYKTTMLALEEIRAAR
jgi:8-oxo-dGTP pyrophosphatase MutT (NUDIX family)